MRWIFGVGVLGVVGCGQPQLAPEVQAVRLTYASEQVASCQSRGLLRAKDGRSGLGANKARAAVERRLRADAHRQGGNVVLLKTMDSSFWGGTKAEGEAFACP